MLRRLLLSVAAGLGLITFASAAAASPVYEFVCPGAPDIQRIGLSAALDEAVISFERAPEVVLTARGRVNERGEFSFAGRGMTFQGFFPEGGVIRPGRPTAQCHQTADSLRTIAIPGLNLALAGRPVDWPRHRAAGFAQGIVRAAPNTASARVTSFADRTPVIILRNTDAFREGFFWFEIEFGGRRGFIWGALLCTEDPARDLKATVRRC
jgi:hypothetical protein